MKIALLHYHLKTGGVTTVLHQQAEALKARCDLLMLTGQSPAPPFPAPVAHIPGLAYDSVKQSSDSPQAVAQGVEEAIYSHWKTGCDVLHVHNPTLTKNRQLLKILNILKSKGFKLLLQIHDFAEDGRPAAFSSEPYPRDCHYGVINSRDYHILRKSGLNPAGLHRLDNMVNPVPCPDFSPCADDYVLYPIRALRRKNIGEAILLAQYFKPDVSAAVTLPPNSPVDLESYQDWKAYVGTRVFNVIFDKGLTHDFGALVNNAKLLITTSITEGFGFSFLEAWTAGKMLRGRILADICRDFVRNGLNLDHLYPRLSIPTQWIDLPAFSDRWRRAFTGAARTMGREIDAGAVEKALSKIIAGGSIDFGLLDEIEQRRVIDAVSEDPNRKKALADDNPFLLQADAPPVDDALIAANRKVVLGCYNSAAYTRRLMTAYRKVSAGTVRHGIDKSVLLNAFMRPDRFSLLKWGEYHG